MNSEQLYQEHTSTYQEFFSHHEFVFSVPLVMTWSGDISGENMIHIQSRIPLRIYTGVDRTSSGGIQTLDITSYRAAEGKFQTTKIGEYMPYIDMLCRDLRKQYPQVNAEISILAEGARSIGLGCTPLILFSIYLAVKNLQDPTLQGKLEAYSRSGAAEYNTSQTLKIFFQEFITLVRPYKLAGSIMNILASFFADPYPFCGFGSGISLSGTATNEGALYCFSLRDFLPVDSPRIPYHALDTSIFYTGQPVFSEQLISGFSIETQWLDRIQSTIRNTINRYPHDVLPYLEPSFLRQGNDFNAAHLAKKYTDVLSLNTLEIFDSMLHIYIHSYDEDSTKSFLQKLNNITWINYVTRSSAKTFMRIKSRLGYLFKDHIGRMGSFPLDTSIMGGCIGLVAPVENLQKEIDANLRTLNEQITESSIIYKSWRDGTEEHGLVLNQDVWKRKMSTFASKNIGILHTIDGKKQIISVEELEIFSRGKLIFDTLNQKVLANRRQFTSKDLPSQQATCDIMKALVFSGGELDNTDLSKSTYSTNKNDMQGKIFTPLNKIYHSIFGKDFPVKITGSSTHFSLTIDYKNIHNIAIFYEIIAE